MHPYPNVYHANAAGSATGPVAASSGELPALATAPPVEFDGPGATWSPETLLVAAIADCFILTFRGVSHAAKFSWMTLECAVDGTLERVDGITRFSRFATRATLTVEAGADQAKARALMERAERGCLVANSLQGERTLEVAISEAT